MTEQEYFKEMSRLKGAVTRAKSALSKPMSLIDKLAAKNKVNAAEDALHSHKLNRFELVQPTRVVIA